MMLSLDTAYRSFGGEVEASSTPTICRLPDSRRHQLSAIARYVIESTLLELCTELSVLAPDIKTVAGPATVKLLDALAAYRDSELTTPEAAPQPDRWRSPFRR